MIQNKCEEAISRLQSQLQEENFTYQDLTDLCQEFPDCTDKLHTHFAWWEELETLEVPEPSEGLRRNFQLLLTEAKFEASKEKSSSILRKQRPTISWKWTSLAATFLLGIVLGGLLLSWLGSHSQQEIIAETTSNTITEKALLTSNSAMERLQALQFTKEQQELDDQIIDILNQILLKDDNINVRLSAMEAMVHFADHPQVKQNLIKAIPYQTSPILQLTLAEAALALDDQRAITKIQELLQQKQLELEVRMKLEDSLKTYL